jgi:hypothetical protein
MSGLVTTKLACFVQAASSLMVLEKWGWALCFLRPSVAMTFQPAFKTPLACRANSPPQQIYILHSSSKQNRAITSSLESERNSLVCVQNLIEQCFSSVALGVNPPTIYSHCNSIVTTETAFIILNTKLSDLTQMSFVKSVCAFNTHSFVVHHIDCASTSL